MMNASPQEKQPEKASAAHEGWLTRAQVAAELGYRSIFPIRKIGGTNLHPVREARGWMFDPAEVSALKATRSAPTSTAPTVSEGRLVAHVFYLFDHGRELREIVQELEVSPTVVRDLWHEWLPPRPGSGTAASASEPRVGSPPALIRRACASACGASASAQDKATKPVSFGAGRLLGPTPHSRRNRRRHDSENSPPPVCLVGVGAIRWT